MRAISRPGYVARGKASWDDSAALAAPVRPEGFHETLNFRGGLLRYLAARGAICLRQNPRVLLRRKPGKFLSGNQHYRHVIRCEYADLQPHSRVRTRFDQRRTGLSRELGCFAGWYRLYLPPASRREVAFKQEFHANTRLQCG